ncbi:MAG: hypothetical protein ACJA1B_002457, partial [Polaribacter sp.]
KIKKIQEEYHKDLAEAVHNIENKLADLLMLLKQIPKKGIMQLYELISF